VLVGLRAAGLQARTPQAATYVWTRVPAGMGSVDFTTGLLEATGVSLTPGVTFGPSGEGYARIAIGLPTPRIHEAMVRLVEWVRGRSDS
jgi:LL-diaminopimelate aminotransferase